MTRLNLIVAIDVANGYSKMGSMPFNIPGDLKMFKKITTGSKYDKNAVIMGYNTYKSLKGPLPGRLNIVITVKHFDDVSKDMLCYKDPDEALKYCEVLKIDDVFIIGGLLLYEKYMDKCSRMFVTRVFSDFGCDGKVVLNYDNYFVKNVVIVSPGPYSVLTSYQKGSNHEEYQYLDLISMILNHGSLKDNRTSCQTLSIFGHTTTWSLHKNVGSSYENVLPLLTTKKMFIKGFVEELLWFLSGSTDSKVLSCKGINIWSHNSSREFLDSVGLGYLEEGNIGAGYGFQWRHFGADFDVLNKNIDFAGFRGVDQIKGIMNLLKNDPNSRRILLTSWNPKDLNKMALPPCHVLFQLYVYNNELSSILYQRSADVGLGVPFNIASYCLLTILMAHCVSMKPGKFTHVMGDTHIYVDHIEALKEQSRREPMDFPTVVINDCQRDIFSITSDDIRICNYKSHGPVKMKVF